MTAKSVSCKRRWNTCAIDIAQVMTVKGYAKQREKRCAGPALLRDQGDRHSASSQVT